MFGSVSGGFRGAMFSETQGGVSPPVRDGEATPAP